MIAAHVDADEYAVPFEHGAYRYYAVTATNRYGMESSATTLGVVE
jgi:hypothetical protein